MKKIMIMFVVFLFGLMFFGTLNKVHAEIIWEDIDNDGWNEYLNIGETITEVSLGFYHSSAITSEGRIFTWGGNNYGQLGDGTTTDRYNPTEITSNFTLNIGETITETSLGYYHSSAITSEGKIFTWGANLNGQLGDGTQIDKDIPTAITSNFSLNMGETITSVSLGYYHSSAITSEGRIFTWGFNYFGELGDGTTIFKKTPTGITNNFNLNIGETVTSVSLGHGYSSAITSEGRIFTWGGNLDGQLGNATTSGYDANPLPIEITGNFSLNTGEIVASVSLGDSHSSVMTSEGRIFTWGKNEYGQLGDGTATNRDTPTLITSNFSLNIGETITSASLGSNYSSAITSEGRIFTWGYNRRGQLGDGSYNLDPNSIPTEITSNFSLNIGETITETSLGFYHSSAITSEGRIFTWGDNYHGKLGDGTATDRYAPTEITSNFSYNTGETITEVSLGSSHSSAITSKGRIFTWGYNFYGQLGDGTNINKDIPTEITSKFNLNTGETITSVSLGSNYSSAITSEGRIFTWGYGVYGQIGDGTTANRYTPIEITSNFGLDVGETITSASLGSNHSSAISSEGRIFIWGSNAFGQIGDGTTTDRYIPIEITGNFSLNVGETITGVSLGSNHSSAITSEGKIFIWGFNSDGQLGDGTTTNRDTPTEITSNFTLYTGETITTVSLGYAHSSAITSEGRIFTWGANANGELGDGTIANRYTPTEITSDFSLSIEEIITSVSLGINHSAAITSEGRIFAWGYNGNGQIGDGTTTNRYTPTEITSNLSLNTEEIITKVSIGSNHSSAITSEGRIFTWGYNGNGQIGDGTTTNRYTPTEITLSISLYLPSYDRIYVISKQINYDIHSQTVEIQILVDYPESIDFVVCNGIEVTDVWYLENVLIFNMPVTNTTYGDTYPIIITELNYNDGTSFPALGYLESNSILVDYESPTFDTIIDQTIESGVPDIDWTTLITNESDNSDGVLTKVEVTDNVDYDTPGTYTVTVKLVDESLNETSQTFNVLVEGTMEDTIEPTFDIIIDQTIETGVADIDWTTLIINESDNSIGVLTKVEVTDNVDYNTPGIYSVTVKLVDESLNEALQSFNVTVQGIVEDTIEPIFDTIIDQTIESGVADIDWTTLITNESDNNNGVLTKIEFTDNVKYDIPGTYTVTVKLVDESLNETSQTFNVKVEDTVFPIISGVLDDGVYKSNEKITIIFNEGTATLNDLPFESGDTVEGEGHFYLRVIDQAGNITELGFEIEKSIGDIVVKIAIFGGATVIVVGLLIKFLKNNKNRGK